MHKIHKAEDNDLEFCYIGIWEDLFIYLFFILIDEEMM